MFELTTSRAVSGGRPDELPDLDVDFAASKRSTEFSAYMQDQFRLGNFAANIGLRFDHYRLFIEDAALSPRVALSYYLPAADLQLHASYDRIFQPPPTENLLLSSEAESLGLEEVEGVLQVPPSRANFFEIGFRKPIGDVLRLDVSHYWRRFENSIDDDVFLNTGLSFPITFDSARVEGTEVRLEMPRWRASPVR
jgi:outer membrane receptor protein involved in Fe transport